MWQFFFLNNCISYVWTTDPIRLRKSTVVRLPRGPISRKGGSSAPFANMVNPLQAGYDVSAFNQLGSVKANDGSARGSLRLSLEDWSKAFMDLSFHWTLINGPVTLWNVAAPTGGDWVRKSNSSLERENSYDVTASVRSIFRSGLTNGDAEQAVQ